MSNALLAIVFFSSCVIVYAVDCPEGSFAESGQTSCTLCPAGKYSINSNLCLPCIAGKYSDTAGQTQSSDCIACQPGTFSIGGGLTVCANCPVGKYQRWTGASLCSECWAGTYSTTIAATHASTCTACEEGFASNPGASVCGCAAGKYNSDLSSVTTCAECVPGKYSDLPSQTSCSDCAA